MSCTDEADIQMWYSQTQVNQRHVYEIMIWKSQMDQLEKQKELNLVQHLQGMFSSVDFDMQSSLDTKFHLTLPIEVDIELRFSSLGC